MKSILTPPFFVGCLLVPALAGASPLRSPQADKLVAESLEALRNNDLKAWDARMRPPAALKSRCRSAGDVPAWVNERIERRKDRDWSPLAGGPCTQLIGKKRVRTLMWLDGGARSRVDDDGCEGFSGLMPYRVVVEDESGKRLEVVLSAFRDERTGALFAGFHAECEQARPYVVACANFERLLRKGADSPYNTSTFVSSTRCEYELKQQAPANAQKKTRCLEAAASEKAARACWGKPIK